MKTVLMWSLLALLPQGERERGLQLYREGKFDQAAAAFRAAIAQEGDSAELQWNLALASWRAGDLASAETAAEKYAALDAHARGDLHAGLLGAVRHDEAMLLAGQAEGLLQAPPPNAPPAAVPNDPGTAAAAPADPLPLFEQALVKATQARDHFVRGAAQKPTPELLRNTERALRTIDELQKKIDELKKQREQQKDDKNKDQNKDDKKDNEKKDEQQKGDQGKDDKGKDDKGKDEKSEPKDQKDQKPDGEPKPEPKDQQSQQGEEKPEPKPEPGKDDKAKDQQAAPEQGKQDAAEPKPSEKRQDAPGEQAEGKQLTPEQAQRLLEQLRDLDEKQKQIRARAKSTRRPVERDW